MAALPHVKCLRTYHKLGCYKKVSISSNPWQLLLSDRTKNPNRHVLDWHKWEESIHRYVSEVIGNLSKDVFERRTSTGSEAFFLFICLDAIKFSLLTFFSLLKTIYPRVLTKPLPNDAKSPLPVDVRRSKTLLLKLPNISSIRRSVSSPDETPRGELKIRRAAEYF